MNFPRHLAWLAPLLMLGAIAAHAAPQCDRRAETRQSALPVNGFAHSPRPQAIATGHARCAWGIGLAIPAVGTGTAFLIGNRREVMTSLHVVDPDCRGNRRFTFSHGFDRGRALTNIGATIVIRGDYCAARARGGHDDGGDWAIAVLDRDPAALEHPSSWTDDTPLEPRRGGRARDDGQYFLLGYGMSFRGGTQPYRSAACRLGRLFSAGVVEHDCDASRRASGAPIVTEDASGNCLVAAIHIGEIASVRGRPAYRDDVNANVAVLASRFAAAARAVARDLRHGRGAREIAADLNSNIQSAGHPPGRRNQQFDHGIE